MTTGPQYLYPLATLFVFSVSACSESGATPDILPVNLSDVALFDDLGALTSISEATHQYTPRDVLWTNGSVKIRQLVLPDGKAAHHTGDTFAYPEGTKFFKTFAYQDASADGLKPIETRVLHLKDGTWSYATYIWNADGSEAALNAGGKQVAVSVTTPTKTFEHTIPSTLQCQVCHEAQKSHVIGFNPQQLNHPSDADSEVARLIARGAIKDYARDSFAAYASDPVENSVLGYIKGNCVHCHAGKNADSNSAFDLSPTVFKENTIGKMVMSSAQKSGIRIVPGNADQSVLFEAISTLTTSGELKPMPPLGVDVLDDDSLAEIRAWIDNLPAN